MPEFKLAPNIDYVVPMLERGELGNTEQARLIRVGQTFVKLNLIAGELNMDLMDPAAADCEGPLTLDRYYKRLRTIDEADPSETLAFPDAFQSLTIGRLKANEGEFIIGRRGILSTIDDARKNVRPPEWVAGIPSEKVSKQHVSIKLLSGVKNREPIVVARDLGSTNGTYIAEPAY